ncbi:MAG: translation initiation factor [Bacteroidales bacterium]|nr:translation initiation factor [Bacteroidales bacterium]
MDWKEALAGIKSDLPEGSPAPEASEKTDSGVQKEPLHILIDKKQRKGKTATLIEGFLCDDEQVKEIARQLRRQVGAGGSCRGGDILLQGDCLSKVREILLGMGYRVKG